MIAITGASPFSTYKAIFDGSGLDLFFPWISSDDLAAAALNLQQTLILTTPLILTGMAVAYVFGAELFNIGGQGQYFVGLYLGAIIGRRRRPAGALMLALALVLGALAGAIGGIAASQGADGRDEVTPTIMLNDCVLWIGVWRSASAARCTPTTRRTSRC